MKVTLVRHTRLAIEPGICYGQSDVDVGGSFEEEAQALSQKLASTTVDAVYASPLQRCQKLAQYLEKGDMSLDSRLKELDFGDWEMKKWDDLPRDYFDIWAQDYGHMAPPNGETFAQLQGRGISFIEEMQSKHANQHLLVVTHGGMIRALIAHVLDMPLKHLFRIEIGYASITQIDYSQTVPKIQFVNG